MHCYPTSDHVGLESSAFLHRYPTSDHSGLEFSALLRSGGLVSPAEFASMIGGIFPIALWSFLHFLGSAPDLVVTFED